MNNDIALSALVMLAQYHGIAVSPKDIEHQFDPERKGISEKAWVLAARQVGLKSRLDIKPITRLPTSLSLCSFGVMMESTLFLQPSIRPRTDILFMISMKTGQLLSLQKSLKIVTAAKSFPLLPVVLFWVSWHALISAGLYLS